MPVSELRKKGIYLLPNLLTTLGLLAGFYAITLAINANYKYSAIAIFVAMVFDSLDGRVARLTNTQSDFGAQYDSMADLLSFAIAPAILLYSWILKDFSNGWLVAFFYVASGSLRLARFNTQVGIEDKNYFQGLPSPASAALNAGFVWFVISFTNSINISTDIMHIITFVAIFIMLSSSLLMISNIRYHSFKSFNLKGRSSFKILSILLLIIVFISIQPSYILFFTFLIYAISGIVLTSIALRKKLSQKHKNINKS